MKKLRVAGIFLVVIMIFTILAPSIDISALTELEGAGENN